MTWREFVIKVDQAFFDAGVDRDMPIESIQVVGAGNLSVKLGDSGLAVSEKSLPKKRRAKSQHDLEPSGEQAHDNSAMKTGKSLSHKD